VTDGNLPKIFKEKRDKVYAFSAYFEKSRSKPGHVDQLTAMEAIMNAIQYREQRIDKEIRHSLTRTSAKYPGKYVRVILLNDYMTIHNAFFDRSYRKKIGRVK
jgi:hypothetical protein